MKFTRLSDTDIRCVMSEQELFDNGLNLDDIMAKTDETKRFFRQLMDKAALKLGIEHGNGIHMASAQISVLEDRSISIVFHEANLEEALEHVTGGDPEKARSLKNRIAEEVKAQKDSMPELPLAMKRELLDMMEEQLKNGGEGSTEALSEIRQLRAELDAQEQNQSIIAELKAAMKKSFVVRFEKLEEGRIYAKNCSSVSRINSTLYKFSEDEAFYLMIQHDVMPDRIYEGIRTLAYDFGDVVTLKAAAKQYLVENSEVLIENNAVEVLREL